MRGIISAAGYVPYRRLTRASIASFMGSGGGKGTRAVASHDEDTTTLGVEAARLALRSAPGHSPDALWFATSVPAYLDKTNAAAVAAALRLPGDVGAYDFGGALRSGMGCLIAALRGSGTNLVVAGDLRDGLPTSADESSGGDAGGAALIGEGPGVLAELVATASATDEFTDRWRAPGDRTSKLWEERFGENRYLALGQDALARALKAAGVEAGDIGRLIVTGMHGRAVSGLVKKLGLGESVVMDDLTSSVGQSGTAHPLLVLASALESMAAAGAAAGITVVALHLADGADALVLRTTDALAGWRPARPVADQVANGAPLPYAKFLAWRGQLQPEPPRRPEPARVSSTAAYRNEEWKFGFVGSKDRTSGAVHLPPSRVSMEGGAVDDMEPVAMADAAGTVVTSTIDRLAYSPSPPIVFAVVDFDGGGRYPVELTDADPDEIRAGSRVEMTFRRLFSADGIHDYFWKARPVRAGGSGLMGSHGIRDKVAIVGMGCTKFAELWDKGLDDLIVDASTEAFASAGVTKDDVDAYWFGTAQSGMSGIALARPLQLRNKPVTRVENYCTTGSEALRGAVYAVASGAYDVAMAVGAEKVKDSGYQGLNAMNPPGDGTARTLTAAAMFSMVAPAYGHKYGVDDETMADVLASIAVKNHHNGARNPRAQFRREITKETALGSPRLAGTLGVFDCAGVADGAAAAIVVRAEDARKYTDKPIYIKALSLAAGSGSGLIDPGYDYTHFPECEFAAADAYAQAGISDPRRQLAMAEVHDCFTPTELVLMEDLGFSPRGTAWKEVLAGTFDLDGELPVNPDGGLKSFGHPVGASGLRMFFECWLQMRGEAPEDRQIATTDRGLAMTHNLGGYPGEMVSFVSVVGSHLG